MPEQATTTPPAPAAAEPPATTTPPQAPSGQSSNGDDKQPPWGDPENFNAEKAWELIQNLRKEKEPDSQLKAQVESLQRAQEEQKKRFAEALGLSEPPKSEDELAETVKSIQERLEQADRKATKLEVAAEHKIPAKYHHLLTETDSERLKAQAATLAELVKEAETPEFQPNPGQGQQPGDTSFDAQIAEAEKAGDVMKAISLKQQRAAANRKKS